MKLTDKEHMVPISELQHLLVKLASEAAELSHAALRAMEFGIDHPYPDTGITIQEKIRQEFNDVLGVSVMLSRLGFDVTSDTGLTSQKIAKVDTMMDVAREYGVLETMLVATNERMRECLTEFDLRCLREKFNIEHLDTNAFFKHCVNHPNVLSSLESAADTLDGIGTDSAERRFLYMIPNPELYDLHFHIGLSLDFPYTDEEADESFCRARQQIETSSSYTATGIYMDNNEEYKSI